MARAAKVVNSHERRAKFFATAAGSVVLWSPLFGFQFLMLWLITLKEDEVFWTNAGGYSVEFREFVQYSYYPLIVMDVLFALAGTVVGVVMLSKQPLSGMFAFAWLPIIWSMIAVTLYLNLGDNILDWIDQIGKPQVPTQELTAAGDGSLVRAY